MASEWVHRFSLFLGGWLLLGSGTALVLGMTDPLLYFVTAYVGFVLAVEYSEPLWGRPTGTVGAERMARGASALI